MLKFMGYDVVVLGFHEAHIRRYTGTLWRNMLSPSSADRHNPEEHRHPHRRDNLKSHIHGLHSLTLGDAVV
jgi:hypothetical protein